MDLDKTTIALAEALTVIDIARHIKIQVEMKEKAVDEQRFEDGLWHRDRELALRADLSRRLGITVN